MPEVQNPSAFSSSSFHHTRILTVVVAAVVLSPQIQKKQVQWIALSREFLDNGLASLLRLQKDPKLALQLFKNPNPNPNDSEAHPLKPFRYNLLHYDLIITKLGRAKMFYEMQQILHQLKHDTRVVPKEIIFCNVISFYGRARLLEHAFQMFDEMSSFNVQMTVNLSTRC
ncbi:hypothetical protein WN943_014462 [Citrus x changshan-huyou]